MNDSINEDVPTLADAFSRLDYSERGLYIQSAINPSLPQRPVFMINRCLVQFLSTLGATFYRTRGRCFSALLFMGTEERRWSFQFPPQDCAAAHSDWSLSATAPIETRGFLAGSFQTLKPKSSQDIHERIPTFDGIHFICEPDGAHCNIGVFVVANGKHFHLSLADVVYDETEAAVEHLAALAE